MLSSVKIYPYERTIGFDGHNTQKIWERRPHLRAPCLATRKESLSRKIFGNPSRDPTFLPLIAPPLSLLGRYSTPFPSIFSKWAYLFQYPCRAYMSDSCMRIFSYTP